MGIESTSIGTPADLYAEKIATIIRQAVGPELDPATKHAIAGVVDAAAAAARSKAFHDGADEVQSHWNDRTAMCNQREQAQRSAQVLREMARR